MKKSKSTTLVIQNERSLINWAMISIVILFLFIAPFNKGLFNGGVYSFEGPIYIACAVAALALMIVGILKFKHYQLSTHRDLLSLLIWLIPITSVISVFQAVSYHSAMVQLYISMAWTAFYLIGLYIARTSLGSATLQFGIIASGYVLTVFGYLNWFGNALFKDALLQGNRLSNVFQYPNAYAAYMICLIFATLVIFNTYKNRYFRWICGAMLLPLILSLLLTLSRGAFLMFPFVLFFYFTFLSWKRQLLNGAYLFVAGVGALVLFKPLTDIRGKLDQQFSAASSLKGWILLIVATVVVTGLIYLINRLYHQKFEHETAVHQFNKTNFLLPTVVLILTAIAYILLTRSSFITQLLPEQIRTRIEGLNYSTSSIFSRNAFFHDALKIIGDYPLFGTGGGGWAALYDSYQEYPYTSNQIHNFFLQYTVETGIAGVLILLLIIVYSMIIFVKNAFRGQTEKIGLTLIYPLFSIAILSHSILDFDMSFLYLSLLVFLGLGASASTDSTKVFGRLSEKKQTSAYYKSYSVFVVIIAAIFLISIIRSITADTSFKKAINIANETGDYNQLKPSLDRAINTVPSHPAYALYKLDILNSLYEQTKDKQFVEEGLDLVHQIENKEKYNFNIGLREYSLYSESGNLMAAIPVMKNELLRHPWKVQAYSILANAYYQLGVVAAAQNDLKSRDQNWDEAFGVYNQAQEKVKYISTLEAGKRYESRDFKITPQLGLPIGQIYFMRQEYAMSSKLLGDVHSDNLDEPLNRVVMRWFLASLKKQGKWHETFYNNLIAKDPNEAVEIEKLVQLNGETK